MAKKSKSRELWAVQFISPDTSREGIMAYHSRKEAIASAVDFIAYEAKEALEGIGWDPDDEAPKLLKAALDAIAAKKFDDAVRAWLEYQDEYDPQDQIAIGPSGDVSSRAMDFQ